jgi:hypothetical protein
MVATSRQPEAGKPVDGGKPCEKRSPVATRCGGCRFCVTAAIKAEYRQHLGAKRELGTRSTSWPPPSSSANPCPTTRGRAVLQQYLDWLNAWGVDIDRDVEAVETTIVDWDNEYAGTGDLWVWLHLDPKTGRCRRQAVPVAHRHQDLDGQARRRRLHRPAAPARRAAVRPKALLNDDTEVDVPEFAGTAILNLRPNAHALIPLPTDRDAHAAFLGAATLQRYFHGQDMKPWVPVDPPAEPRAGHHPKGLLTMPIKIIELQRRFAEQGRIRLGHKGRQGGRPAEARQSFRFTSPRAVHPDLAELYGGTPQPGTTTASPSSRSSPRPSPSP